MYGIIIFFIKLSILLQFLELFAPAGLTNTMYWACHSLIWINLLFYLISTFLEIFSCKPRQKAWNPLITSGSCIDTLVLNVAASAINAVSDLILLILPQLMIWRLRMAVQRRIAVSAVFLIAIL